MPGDEARHKQMEGKVVILQFRLLNP